MRIAISPEKFTKGLALVALSLIGISLIGRIIDHFLSDSHLLGRTRLFDVNTELNVPTWYSSAMLLLCSLLLAVIAVARHQERRRYVAHWRGLAIIFLLLSIDEVASLHERTIPRLRAALNATGFLYSTWVVLGAAFVLCVLLLYLRFLGHLPQKTRRLFLLAGSVYVGGAIGVELLHGYWLDFYGKDMVYDLIASVEEMLEMLGIVTFIYALLSYIRAHLPELQVDLLKKNFP